MRLPLVLLLALSLAAPAAPSIRPKHITPNYVAAHLDAAWGRTLTVSVRANPKIPGPDKTVYQGYRIPLHFSAASAAFARQHATTGQSIRYSATVRRVSGSPVLYLHRPLGIARP